MNEKEQEILVTENLSPEEFAELVEKLRPATEEFKAGKPGIQINPEKFIEEGMKRLAAKKNGECN